MLKKYTINQSGFTLIELLAALTLVTIVLGLTVTVLLSTINFNQKSESMVNLRQEANIIISQMRNQYHEEEAICHDDLLLNSELTMDLKIDNTPYSSGACFGPINADPVLPDIQVEMKLTHAKEHNTFDMFTVIEGKTIAEFTIPSAEENFFEYVKNNNVFVYGSTFSIGGGVPVNSADDGSGTIVINNLNSSNLIFDGHNKISVKNIYIDKEGNKVIFDNETSLGTSDKTQIVLIDGDVVLNNGGNNAGIFGDTIYINGSVEFNNSAKIIGKTVIITGNVTFRNWSALLQGDNVYIGGTVNDDTGRQFPNIVGNWKSIEEVNDEEIPDKPQTILPTFREESWYSTNGYDIRTSGNLYDGVRIYSTNSFTANNWHPDTDDVVIISNADISIKNFGGSDLTGILFAPNGKVTFDGASFRGVVIARDGFDVVNEGSSITFTNVDEYITDTNKIPFK